MWLRFAVPQTTHSPIHAHTSIATPYATQTDNVQIYWPSTYNTLHPTHKYILHLKEESSTTHKYEYQDNVTVSLSSSILEPQLFTLEQRQTLLKYFDECGMTSTHRRNSDVIQRCANDVGTTVDRVKVCT